DLASLVAGTMYRGQFEDRIKKVMDEIEKLGNCILFVDELHTVVGAGSAEGSLDAANILKPSLAKGKIRLIGATTSDEYRRVIEKDSALERRLQKVNVEEPSVNETIEILKGIRSKYEDYHNVKIVDDAVLAAVNLSKRYIADRFLPDKAIDLIDEAAAARHIEGQTKQSPKITNLEKQLKMVSASKEHEVQNQNYQKAAGLRDLEVRIADELKFARETWQNKLPQKEINANDIARVVSTWTNVPTESLAKADKSKYLNLSRNLKKFIIGQDDAIRQISQAIRRSKTGISDPNRPIGSFIFLGPTGVGKTELARVLAYQLFGSRDAIVKIDMSEFMERHNISRLVGAPPGYVGYDDAGRLTEEVRRRPYSIVLFDEIEKAHPEIFNMLLQIFEDGQLTDAKGKKVNFQNTIIILTSNIGVSEFNAQAAIGFQARGGAAKKAEDQYDKMKDNLVRRLKENFRPELMNRLDKIIVFKPLSKNHIARIVDLNLNILSKRLLEQGLAVKFGPKIKDLIIKKGFDPLYGARPIKRAIADLIEDPLSEEILTGKINKGDHILMLRSSDTIVFKLKKSSKV
ncbi:MAG: ATPase domain protein, partial [Candidatus Berkelbacteria bacterium]|nr:ATPase domain protein [Candidatus Berkelbacteria bacterium]